MLTISKFERIGPEERDCEVQQTALKNHAKRSAKAGPEKHISPPRV